MLNDPMNGERVSRAYLSRLDGRRSYAGVRKMSQPEYRTGLPLDYKCNAVLEQSRH